MLIKLNSSLQTRNYLGLSDKDLAEATIDPYYQYLRTGSLCVTTSKAGGIITLEGPELDVHRDYLAIVQVNPMLHMLGSVSTNSFFSGKGRPTAVVRTYRKDEEMELDWLFEIRLLK